MGGDEKSLLAIFLLTAADLAFEAIAACDSWGRPGAVGKKEKAWTKKTTGDGWVIVVTIVATINISKQDNCG